MFAPPRESTSATLAHLDVESASVQELIRELVQHHVAITSTLPVFETYVPLRAPSDSRVLESLQPTSRADYLETRVWVNKDRGESQLWPVILKRKCSSSAVLSKRAGC